MTSEDVHQPDGSDLTALSRQDGTAMTDDEIQAVRDEARRTAAQIMSEEAV